MAISNAVERDGAVYIYDEAGNQSGIVPLTGQGQNDGLKGYTSSSVNVLRDGTVYTYDQFGVQISFVPG